MAFGLFRKRGQPDAIAKNEGKTAGCRVDKRILDMVGSVIRQK